MAYFTISGVNEAERALRLLGPKVGKKVIRQAMRKALKPVAAEVKVLAPVETGRLRAAVKTRAGKRRKRGAIALEVQLGDQDFQGKAYYGAFQEYGTSKMPGKGFMRRAFDAKAGEAKAIARREIRAGIEREASKS